MSIIRPTLAQIARATLGPLAAARLPWEMPGGAGLRFLNLASGGTFTRSTEGSYLTGAPTDGSAAFLAWAGVDVRRIEDRGDGLGAMLLLEGSRTASILRSYDFANASWTAVGLTATADTNAGPDGLTTADTLAFTASGTAQISQPFAAVPADNARAVVTVWLRAAAAQTVRLFIRQKDGVTEGAAVTCNVTTTWQRFELNQSVGVGASAPLLIIRNGVDAAARNVFAILADVECSAALTQFPTSTVRTLGAAVTRGADILSYAAGQYPASFLTRGFRVQCAPDFSSAENAGLTEDVLGMATITNGGVAFDSATLGVYRPGVGWLFTACTWSRGQLLTITVVPAVSVTLAGFTTGNGTYALSGTTWASDTLSVGQRAVAGTQPFFGRISPTIVGL